MQNLTNYNKSGLFSRFFYYYRSTIIQKSIILNRWVYFNPFILPHWLLNSGHKASTLSLPFTCSSQQFQLVPFLQQPPRLLNLDDSIQNQGEASVPQSQSFHGTRNQLYPRPQPVRFTSSYTRQLGTCAKRHQHTNWHQDRKRSTKPPASASLCFPWIKDLDPSSLKMLFPCRWNPSLSVLAKLPATQRLRKYYRCKTAAWQTFSIHK